MSVSDVLRVSTSSPEESVRFGRALGSALRAGDLVALMGTLGSGKTVIVRGAAEGLGYDGYVTSPTFVLVNEYSGRIPVLHVDLYRVSDPRELEDIGYREVFFGEGAALVEWAERAGELLPEDRLEIHIEVVGPEARLLTARAIGSGSELLKRLRSAWDEESNRC